MDYLPRVVDAVVERSLSIAGAILIEGVRACGKTVTGLHHSRSSVRLDTDSDARQLAELSPALVLEGEAPRLVDEWQLEPQLWNHVRRAVDDRRRPGQFILTGSATPADDATRHAGAGRILRVRMRPMSLYESGHSTGSASLARIMAGEPVAAARSALDLRALTDRLCVGGWPGMLSLTADEAQLLLRSYLDDVARADIQAADDTATRRDPVRVRRLLAAYARHVATPASMSTIAADTADDLTKQIRADTTADYLTVLQRVMVIEEQPSWGPHLRSRDVVRQGPIRHFVDPSLAVAGLGASAERLLREPVTLGHLFESLVIRDLRIYAQAIDADVVHYRDSAGTEADGIVQLRDGRWAAVEVKLGASQVDAAVASLNALTAKIDTVKAGEPVARIVITGGEYAYTRPDGVHVVPLACLGP